MDVQRAYEGFEPRMNSPRRMRLSAGDLTGWHFALGVLVLLVLADLYVFG